jgi:ATP adenylyltransferase
VKLLWAPWRAEYIDSAPCQHRTDRRHCLFCRTLAAREDEQRLVLHRGRLGFVMMNRFPYNNGHLMVAPVRHVAAFDNLTDREGQELFALTRRCVAVLGRTLRPQGYNVGSNLGRAAGAGVAGHLHIHIVPRWNGDVNFMPLLGETKVISEHLRATCDRLRRGFSPPARPGSRKRAR